MGRQFRFPSYPKTPHSSGQARIKIRGREYYLGPWNSVESHREYQRLYNETLIKPPDVVAKIPAIKKGQTLVEVFADFVVAMKKERGDDWRELDQYRRALSIVDRVCPNIRIDDFDTRHLSAVRDAMVSGSWMNAIERANVLDRGKPIGWSRSYANQQIVRVRSVVRWAESMGTAPRGAWEHLRTLRRIRLGQPNVRHSDEKRQAVGWDRVEPVLPHLRPSVRALVLVLWWTGARPSEIVQMRACDLRECDDSLEYRPREHKTRHLGKDRLIVLGPRAASAIRPILDRAKKRSLAAVVFPASPRRQPKGRGPVRPMTVNGLCRAVQVACRSAGVERWTPYQLRHAAKLRITRELGLDAARAALGHSSIGTTNNYASMQDAETAHLAAKKCG